MAVCTHPNGDAVLVPILFSTMAWIMAVCAASVCTFLQRHASYDGSLPDYLKDYENLFLDDHGVGLWGWELNGNCYSYTIDGKSPNFDSKYNSAKAFTGVTAFVGGLGMICLWMSLCFPMPQQQIRMIGGSFFFACFFEGLTLVILNSSICNIDFFSYMADISKELSNVSVSCSPGKGANLAISSVVFWFLAAALCMANLPRPADDGPVQGDAEPLGGAEGGLEKVIEERSKISEEDRTMASVAEEDEANLNFS